MTLQVLLSMILGFGILTLATVALLNVAGHRLHDLEVFEKRGRECAFVYKYSSKAAAELRLWFARLPWFLLFGAFLAIGCTLALLVEAIAYFSERGAQDAQDAKVLDWMWLIMATYVLILVLVTTIMSGVLYGAIGAFNKVLPPTDSTGDQKTN